MRQMDVETEVRPPDAQEHAEYVGETAGPGRFVCPSCGSMLRTGAILCPHCDADLWTMAHGGPAPSSEAQGDGAVDEPLPASGSPDGRLGRRSLVLGAAAVGADLLLALVAAAAGELSWLWSLLGWATALIAVPAVFLARKVVGRGGDARGERGPTVAKYGLILGMASLAYEASTFITWSIDQVIRNVHA